MRTHPQLMKTMLLLIIGMLLIVPFIASAQEEGEPAGEADTSAEVRATDAEEAEAVVEDQAEEEAPAGIGLLFLLMGLGGVVIVGGRTILRNMYFDGDEVSTEAA